MKLPSAIIKAYIWRAHHSIGPIAIVSSAWPMDRDLPVSKAHIDRPKAALEQAVQLAANERDGSGSGLSRPNRRTLKARVQSST